MIEGMAKKLPVKHVAKPDEIAEAYVFLMKYVSASGLVNDTDIRLLQLDAIM